MKAIEHLHIFKYDEDAIPDQKMAISVSETMLLSIQNNYYVDVVEYYSPNINIPNVRGYAFAVNDVGGSTL